jgi:hypothetical protein
VFPSSKIYPCFKALDIECTNQGSLTEGGRLSTVELLVPTSYDQLIFIIFYKTSYLNEDANCTETSPSVRLPCTNRGSVATYADESRVNIFGAGRPGSTRAFHSANRRVSRTNSGRRDERCAELAALDVAVRKITFFGALKQNGLALS